MTDMRYAATALLCLLGVAEGTAQDTFRVGDVAAGPGRMVSGRLVIAPGGDDDGTFVPVTVVRGARPGPVLALVAGVHGSEYSPILALQRVRRLVDPAGVSGTLVMVHVANVPAFLGRTVYVSPGDGRNLNRVFPGNANGTVTERIADALTREVIARADYVMDIHSGDGNESLRPSYTGYYAEAGGPEVIERSRQMALAFGLDTIVEFQGELDPASAIWCGSAAVARGIPAIDVESGEMGLVEDRRVEPIVDGVLSVMRHLDMLEGDPSPTESPLFIRERAYVTSGHDGVWHPDERVRAGHYVRQGARLGVVTVFYGNELADARAPASGMLLILLGTPPVNRDETLAVIARVE